MRLSDDVISTFAFQFYEQTKVIFCPLNLQDALEVMIIHHTGV